MVTREVVGVLRAGLQRERRSGRGRPTVFLIMSVRRAVRRMVMARPRVVVCALCVSRGGRARVQRRIVRRGRRRA